MPEHVISRVIPATPVSPAFRSRATPFTGPRAWATDLQALKKWFRIFLVAWLAGGAILLVGISASVEAVLYVGFAGFIGSVIPYLKSLQYSYRVQSKLNSAKLYTPGAWQVVVAGLMLNPFVLGFLIPASVLRTVKKIDRELDSSR